MHKSCIHVMYAHYSPPRLLDIASFVLDIGTTSFAQTLPAIIHNSNTEPIPIRRDESGSCASNTCDDDATTASTIPLSISATNNCVDDDIIDSDDIEIGKKEAGDVVIVERRRVVVAGGKNAIGYVIVICLFYDGVFLLCITFSVTNQVNKPHTLSHVHYCVVVKR